MQTNFTTLTEFSALRQVGELSDEGVAIFSFPEGSCCYVNDTAIRFLGREENAISLADFYGPTVMKSDRKYVEDCIGEMRAGKRQISFDLRAGSAEVRTLSCKLFCVMDDDYAVAMMRDVTREKKGNEHMIEFGSKKNMLLDSLVHNLSGALSMMQNLAAEATRDKEVASGRAAHYLKHLNFTSRFCIDLINDLLIDEHEHSHRTVAKKERFDLVGKIEYVIEELRTSFSSKIFSLKNEASSAYVISDDVKILQVVVNLISNSIKFTSENAQINVVIADHDEDFIRIEVSDNGIGIPETLQPFVFERKGIAGRPGLNGEKSIGLGLAINKQLVGVIGGQLWLRSTVNEGSSFYFTIPKK